mgnify:CR=1 FL=1
MEYRYEPEGVCSYEMIFEIENNIIKKCDKYKIKEPLE